MQIRHYLIALVLLTSSCSVPRVMNHSARVAPKGTVTGGVSYMANVSQVSGIHITNAVVDFAGDIKTDDSLKWSNALESTNKALLAYSVDPLSQGFQFYLRVGVVDRLELGFQKAGKANMLESNFQFLGPLKKQEPQHAKRLYGSLGARFAWSNFKLPSYLEKVQSRLGYDFKRRDLLIPLTFSYSFGPDETYGSFSTGVVAGWHFLSYAFIPDRIYDGNGIPFQADSYKSNYRSFGFFFNAKVGYKYVYIIPSMSIYYQNFGSYPLLDKSAFPLKGWSFVPAISFQLQSPGKTKKNKG